MSKCIVCGKDEKETYMITIVVDGKEEKCIELDSNPKNNTYLSMALSNLAELYDDAGATKYAIKYYNESIKIDSIIKNYFCKFISSNAEDVDDNFLLFNNLFGCKK